MEGILSRARKFADQAEVFQATSKTTPVRFESNRLKHVQTKESTTTALRLLKNGRIGFAQVSGFVKPEILVDMALETSQFGAEAKFDFPGPQTYPAVETLDTLVDKVTIEEMVQSGQQMIDDMIKHTSDLLCEVSVNKGIISVLISNSKGSKSCYTKSSFGMSLEGVLVRNGDMLFVGDSQSSCHPILDTKSITKEVIRQLEYAKTNSKISAKAMPVIFTPLGVASALLTPLVTAFNGKTVLEGASPLKDKLNKLAFDRSFTLCDNATLPYQIASCPSDDEGIPSQQTFLVKAGVVSSFYYDLQTAALVGTSSTGNGHRSGGLPTPSPTSLIISEGTIPYQDMVKDISEGLIIDMLMGAEQGNILNGDFSGNVLLGYKVEKGEVIGRVKDTMVSGNVFTILKNIGALSRETKWIGGILQTPYIYCNDVSVATK